MGLLKSFPAYGIAVALLTSITTASQNATCYYPDGSPVSNYVPCKDLSTDGVTYCCAAPSVCTTGGYCLGNAGVFYRGGCTDQTWTSNLCPELCAKVMLDNFANFYPCTPGQFTHNNWVCGDPNQPSTNFCDSSEFNSSFTFDPGAPFVPEIEAVTATSTVTVFSSATARVSSTATASGLPNTESCPTHSGTILGLGVGLGVGMGLLTIAAFFCFFAERRKRKSAEKDAAQARAPSYYRSELKGDSNIAHEAASQTLHEIGHSHRTP